jgi:hypothetical protein
MKTNIHSWLLLRMVNVTDKTCAENQNTFYVHTFFFFFFRKTCRLWDNGGKYCRPGLTGHRWQYSAFALHAGYPTLKKTHTLRIYNTYCFSTATMVARTGLIGTLYSAFRKSLCTYKRCSSIERTIVSKNWIKQLHTLPALHFNSCLTN